MTNRSKIIIVLFIPILLICSGCSVFSKKSSLTNIPEFNTKKDIIEAKQIVENNTKEINEATSIIYKETQVIQQEVNKIKNKIPFDVKDNIDTNLNTINENSDFISNQTQIINKSIAKLTGATSLLTNAEDKVKSIEKKIEKVIKERDDAIAEKDKLQNKSEEQLNSMLIWLIGASIVACGGFAVLFVFSGSKLGIIGCGASVLILIIATAMKVYFLYVAIGGGVLLLLIIGYMAYNIITNNKAFQEVISTVEVAKENLPKDKKEKLFGEKNETGIMDTIQSPRTMSKVRKEKSKISNLWSYAKNNES